MIEIRTLWSRVQGVHGSTRAQYFMRHLRHALRHNALRFGRTCRGARPRMQDRIKHLQQVKEVQHARLPPHASKKSSDAVDCAVHVAPVNACTAPRRLHPPTLQPLQFPRCRSTEHLGSYKSHLCLVGISRTHRHS